MKYAIVIEELSAEDGGGYVGIVPDLNGCMSDGETPEEALENTRQAIDDWIEAQQGMNRAIPAPGTAAERTRRERNAVLSALHALVESYGDPDGRAEDLENELKNVLEELRNEAGWSRAGGITVGPTVKHRLEPKGIPA